LETSLYRQSLALDKNQQEKKHTENLSVNHSQSLVASTSVRMISVNFIALVQKWCDGSLDVDAKSCTGHVDYFFANERLSVAKWAKLLWNYLGKLIMNLI